MNSKEASKQRRRVAAAMHRQIDHYRKCISLLHRLDEDVLAAGHDLFEDDDDALASWLAEPALALGGTIPLHAMRSAKGRKKVANILRALAYGVYL
jgi:uncharacterized protein (DUF2384 family)